MVDQLKEIRKEIKDLQKRIKKEQRKAKRQISTETPSEAEESAKTQQTMAEELKVYMSTLLKQFCMHFLTIAITVTSVTDF